MGYEYHITRAENWVENAESPITPDEWLAFVDKDPELIISGSNGPYFADWRHTWFDLVDGNIDTKNPDLVTLDKMLVIANAFNACVQGDDGDVYDGTQSADLPPTNLVAEWARFLGIYFLVTLSASLLSTLACYLFGFFG